MNQLTYATTIAIVIIISVAGDTVPKVTRKDPGRGVKLRILVDKVMQPEEGWVTKEWMIRETVEAGFNVYSPRKGYDKLEEVRQVTRWCEKYGIYHTPWMRGSLTAPAGAEADGKRLVWASGNEQPLWSPNSDEFWEWTNRYIIAYAKISAEMPNLIGVFLDYENYAPGKEGNLYSLSYDDIIMGEFASSKGIKLPKLTLDKRKEWLEKQGLHGAFKAFQVRRWRERCRALREAVDKFNPKFQFCIYPAPGTLFIIEATYREWATDEAPLILADASTYGRASKFLPQAESLEKNLERLTQRMEIPRQADIPFIYVGGIDPVVRGADPEFCGKNAVMISENTDGYWIFYEGPNYKKDHPDYFKWFTWANRAIAEGNFEAWHEPRETPEHSILGIFESAGKRVHLVPPEVTGEKVEFPTVRLRGENLLLLAVKTEHPVELMLENHPIARYHSSLRWEIRNSMMEKVDGGVIPHGKRGVIRFTPKTDGIYLLGASAGNCAYSVVTSNVPVGLYAGEWLHFIYGSERLYFKAPDKVEQFTLAIRGSDGETVRVNVYNPEGVQVATGQTTLKESKTEINVSVGEHAGKIWALALTKADEGILEDNSIQLDSKLPPTLSFIPEHVFGIKSVF